MTWQISAAANGVIGIAYLVIAYIILGGLFRTNQVTTNKLGLATGLIFLTCGDSGRRPLRGAMLEPEAHGDGGCMTERRPISAYPVDDVPEPRELIRFGMEEDPGFEVVGEAGDGRSALKGISATQPAAVLLDLSMPDMDGLEAIPEIRKGDPDVAIIVLSGFSADRIGGPALERGADGYVEKGTPIQELRDATRMAVAKRRVD